MTSDLDEFTLAALDAAPVDGDGVGTALVTGSGHPTSEFVYKLVARSESDELAAPMVAVAKKSINKVSVGGRKYALRRLSEQGTAEAEIIGIGAPPSGDSNDRPLLVQLVDGGQDHRRGISRHQSRATQKRSRRAAARGAQDVSG